MKYIVTIPNDSFLPALPSLLASRFAHHQIKTKATEKAFGLTFLERGSYVRDPQVLEFRV